MKGFGYAVAAVAGAALGAFVMYKVIKKAIEKAEEPAEVVCTVDDIRNKAKTDVTDTEIVLNSSIAQTYKGKTEPASDAASPVSSLDYILVIDPDELGMEYGSDSITELMLYDNNILTDDMDKVIDIHQRIQLFGNLDIRSHFGDYDPDTVAVRDTLHHIDYEIARSEREFDIGIGEENTEWEDVK